MCIVCIDRVKRVRSHDHHHIVPLQKTMGFSSSNREPYYKAMVDRKTIFTGNKIDWLGDADLSFDAMKITILADVNE